MRSNRVVILTFPLKKIPRTFSLTPTKVFFYRYGKYHPYHPQHTGVFFSGNNTDSI